MKNPALLVIMLVFLTFCAGSSSGQDFVPGVPIQVTAPSTDQNADARIDSDAEGNFVVVWERRDLSQTGIIRDIFARKYNGKDEPVTPVIEVLADNEDVDDAFSEVVLSDDGSFLIVWREQVGSLGNTADVLGQRFDRSGARIGGIFQLADQTAYLQSNPEIGQGEGFSSFVLAWSDDLADGSRSGVSARRFGPAAEPRGPVFRVNTYTLGTQGGPQLVVMPDGKFLAAWSSFDQDGSEQSVFAQRFDRDGARIGEEFAVSSYTSGRQSRPSIAALPDGGFLAAWEGWSERLIKFRLFDSSGTPGPEQSLESPKPLFGIPVRPVVTASPEGYAAIIWELLDQRFIQRVDPQGQAVGETFQMEVRSGSFFRPHDISGDRAGNFVVAYSTRGAYSSSTKIEVIRFRTANLGGRTFLDINGNGVREPGELGVPGIPVRLLDDEGNVLRTASTGAQGRYAFGVLPVGEPLSVRFEPSSDWQLTVADVGSDDYDSDADPQTGETEAVTLERGEPRLRIDAGLVPVAGLFIDGFESGDLTRWSTPTPQ